MTPGKRRRQFVPGVVKSLTCSMTAMRRPCLTSALSLQPEFLFHGLLAPGFAKEPQPVSVHDSSNRFPFVAATGKQFIKALQIGNSIEIARRLLAAKAAVQVAADGGMIGIARKLADMIDVLNYGRQLDAGLFRERFAALPAGDQHPGVQGAANDRAPPDQAFDLFISQLTLVRDQGPAIVMTGQH